MYTLSISKPEEYRFFDISEVSDYFEGKAFVPGVNGKIRVRLEDIVFLKEALKERKTFNDPPCPGRGEKVEGSCKGIIGIPWGLTDLRECLEQFNSGPFIDPNLNLLGFENCVKIDGARLQCAIFGVTTLEQVYLKPTTYDCLLSRKSMTSMYSFLNKCSRKFGVFPICWDTEARPCLNGSIKQYSRGKDERYNTPQVEMNCYYIGDTQICPHTAHIPDFPPTSGEEKPTFKNTKGKGSFFYYIGSSVVKSTSKIKLGTETYSEDTGRVYNYDEPYCITQEQYTISEICEGINPGELTGTFPTNEYVKGGKVRIYGRFNVEIVSYGSSIPRQEKESEVAILIGEGIFSQASSIPDRCGGSANYSKITLTSTISDDLLSVAKKIIKTVSATSTLEMIESKEKSLANIDYPPEEDVPEPESYGVETFSRRFDASINIECKELVGLYDGLTWNTTFS